MTTHARSPVPPAHRASQEAAPCARAGQGVVRERLDDDLLDQLRDLETRLRSAEVAVLYTEKPDHVVRRFVDDRRELTLLVERLETARLEAVADRLDHMAGRLRAGLRDLSAHARHRADAMDTLETLDRVLGIGARIAALAV